MGKKILIFGIMFFAISAVSFAQETFGFETNNQVKIDSIELVLEENQLELYAKDIDLYTLKVSKVGAENENLPQLIMPTAHANVYAIADFTDCLSGTYLIQGSKGQTKLCYTIIFKKD